MQRPCDLHITLVQTALAWEAPSENKTHFENLLAGLKHSDLILLPEMFTTGFSMKPEHLAEKMDGPSMQWMHSLAKTHDAVVTGSLIIQENGKYYNRLIWMRPDGSYAQYDKRHLFSFAQEEEHYTAGHDRLIVDLKGWRVCPLVCYDLRFPAWIRNQDWNSSSTDPVYDLLLFVANWPAARAKAWTNLLEARAHENQCFVAGVNRIGADGNGIPHDGHCLLIDPKGSIISDIQPNEEGVHTYTLPFAPLESFRQKFTAWKDADNLSLDL
jgi:predicted amidohydrolase